MGIGWVTVCDLSAFTSTLKKYATPAAETMKPCSAPSAMSTMVPPLFSAQPKACAQPRTKATLLLKMIMSTRKELDVRSSSAAAKTWSRSTSASWAIIKHRRSAPSLLASILAKAFLLKTRPR